MIRRGERGTADAVLPPPSTPSSPDCDGDFRVTLTPFGADGGIESPA